jgi:hypothetical protein
MQSIPQRILNLYRLTSACTLARVPRRIISEDAIKLSGQVAARLGRRARVDRRNKSAASACIAQSQSSRRGDTLLPPAVSVMLIMIGGSIKSRVEISFPTERLVFPGNGSVGCVQPVKVDPTWDIRPGLKGRQKEKKAEYKTSSRSHRV